MPTTAPSPAGPDRPGRRVASEMLSLLQVTRRPSWSGCLLAACILLGASGDFGPLQAQPAPPGPRLSDFWQTWLAEVGPLLSDEERLYFEILEDDRARERFLEAFWRSRGDKALERWGRNKEAARRMRSRSPWRERTVLLAGKPGSIETVQRCGALRRLEIWKWEPWHLRFQNARGDGDQYLIFVESTTLKMSSFEPWTPGDAEALVRGLVTHSTLEGLVEALDSTTCIDGGTLARLSIALEQAISFDDLRRITAWPEPGTEWLRALRAPDPRASGLPAGLRLSYPGAFTRYTILHGEIEVPISRLYRLVPGRIFDRVTITGDIFQSGRLADTFEIVHHVAGAAPGDRVVLDFYRRLEPGRHRLRLRVADRNGIALLRQELELEVPELTEPAPEPAGSSEGLSRLTRADLVQLTTFPSVELLPALMNAAGKLVIRAITTGGPISAVEFRLGDEIVATDGEPPYALELEPIGVETALEALALDPAGRELARDARQLAPPDRPFDVRFGETRPADGRVEVLVSLPNGERVARLECRHGRRATHSSTRPPWECPLPEPDPVGAEYVTARVTLESGDSQEDVLFLGPRAPEQVDVQLAELYLSILDRTGRPARGLVLEDVRVWEAGKERPVVRIEPVGKLPLNVAVLMDISSSMGRDLAVATDSAQDFFERVLTDHDRASLLAFNHDLHLLVPFSGDSEALRYGAAGLRSWGATRLHDAMAYALFQFSGLTSRRALIVLSDGADVGSDFPLEQVARLAVRAGVMVYPISLGRVDLERAADLEGLAQATGGRAFRVAGARQLPEVYRRIEEELRAQYLLVYRPAGSFALELPAVKVEILRTGYEAREVRRYY